MNQPRFAPKYYFSVIETLIIVLLASVPLFVNFPYRVNIFLSWEGAYRISEGQLPFRDFGTPLGGMYWIIPGIFFKIFGTQLITLVKAQVFINIISGLAFRSIMKSLGLTSSLRVVALLLYCVSFSFFNFWPWYNHTVIVYEFVGLSFLCKAITGERSFPKTAGLLVFAAFFTVCSFLTKQDAGAMAFLLAALILAYPLLAYRDWKPLLVFAAAFVILLALFILPFINSGFGYWFNHGQAPHSARISLTEITIELLENSQWIKFYFFIIFVLLFFRFRSFPGLWKNKKEMLFLLLTLGVLGEAAVFQVTSYTPPDNNIFFHSFAIAYIFYQLAELVPAAAGKKFLPALLSVGILLWWSGVFSKYIQRVAYKFFPQDTATVSPGGENLINRKTYMIGPVDSSATEMSSWVYCGLKSFEKISMPVSTAEGIKRLMAMDIIRQQKDIRLLNMSELTPLAAEIPYKTERGSHYPLWNHLGVGMFNKQAEMFEKRIVAKEYDMVLFEYIPSLNNFFPFRVRDSLLNHYQKIDSFAAPRRGDTKGMIEVFVKPAGK
ncbi:MAG: hypothetical protein HZA79_14205 [Sphingobacteriales bacterium]|nr:hypothetical protein [Sphingobacteriales bacterium]